MYEQKKKIGKLACQHCRIGQTNQSGLPEPHLINRDRVGTGASQDCSLGREGESPAGSPERVGPLVLHS